MPRQSRSIVPGVVYHLISRFVDREWFIESESERSLYLDLLGGALAKTDWRCLAYGVMSNHFHLAARAGTDSLASWTRRVHSPFADAMNLARGRIGVMFVRGPKAIATTPESVGALIAYIHNNPVRAGIVEVASASTWTSHRQYVGITRPPPWLHVGEGMALSGFRDADAFDRWVTDPTRRDPEDIVRDCHVAFTSLGARPQRSSRLATIDPNAIVQATAVELQTSVALMRSRRRGATELAARAVAIHCAARLGVTGAEIADAIGVSQQRVSVVQRTAIGVLQETCDRVMSRVAR
jgi:hypothetical protein